MQSLALVLTNQSNTEHVQIKQTNPCNPQNGPNRQQYNTLKKFRLRERTDRAWFSRLHPVRKRSGSILTTPEPAHGM